MLLASSLSINAAALPVLASVASDTGTFALVLEQLRSDSSADQYVALRTLELCAPDHPLATQAEKQIARLAGEETMAVETSFVDDVQDQQAQLKPLLHASQGDRASKAVARLRELVAMAPPSRLHPLFPSPGPQEGSGASPITRLIDSTFYAGDTSLPQSLKIAGHIVTDKDDPHAAQRLQELFGRPVSIDDLLRGFSIDFPGYHLKHLRVDEDAPGRSTRAVMIDGAIVTETRRVASEFCRTIRQAPEPGTLWVARANGYNSVDSESFTDHTQRGLCRHVHQRFLAFLHHLGVDVFILPATMSGSYAWPRLGFDFADEQIREIMKICFQEYLYANNISLSLEKEREWARIAHAWELAGFQLESGREVGKEFLLYHGEIEERTYATRFWLNPNYPGWRQLFKYSLV